MLQYGTYNYRTVKMFSFVPRIGFACKYSQIINDKVIAVPEYNFSSTTMTWLRGRSNNEATARLVELLQKNCKALRNIVDLLSTWPINRRMYRIGSDMLPGYTHPDWTDFWTSHEITQYLSKELGEIGKIARANDIRLSMHPGQFVVLASDRPEVVERSIAEFEYHVDIARYLGYGQKFQDFKINVHISGKQGPNGIRSALTKMTPEAHNTMTIENEENAWGLDSCLELAGHVPIVLDVHHHWLNSAGEYISITDERVTRVIDSWRGVRPTMHYSVSREDVLPGHCSKTKPDFGQLIASGNKKAKLRAHSDYYWNSAVNQWALEFGLNFDIMCESKAKNLAVDQLFV